MHRKVTLPLLVLGIALLTAHAARASHWTTLTGQAVDPVHNPGRAAAVLFFVAVDCPNSNQYSPFFNKLVTQYSPKHVAFYVIHEDDGVTAKEALTHARAYGYQCPVMLDPDHSLARRYHITITPEVAVLGPKGQEQYHGRIDDRYVSCGSASNQSWSHDLLDALGEVLAGRPVTHPDVPGAGCSIYYKP